MRRSVLPWLLALGLAAPQVAAGPDLRARAIVSAYEALSRSVPDPKAGKAFQVLRARAPRLLHDLPLQRLFWTASMPLQRGDPRVREVKRARSGVVRAGYGEPLKDPLVRKAYRYFFQRAAMRQRLAPLVEAVQRDVPRILEASRHHVCLQRLRVANAAALLFEVENRRSPGEDAAAVARMLTETGYLGVDPRCPMDLGACDYDPARGFQCAEVGSSAEPRGGPEVDVAALRQRARRNPYLAALLELAPLPEDDSGPPFDTLIQRALAAQTADPGRSLELLARAREAFPEDAPGSTGFSLGFLEIDLLLHTRDFDAARVLLEKLVARAEARDPVRKDQLAAAEGVRARIERMAGRWAASAEAAQRSDRLLIEAFGRDDPRRVGPLHAQATVAKLEEDHAKASALLDEAIGLLEDSGLRGMAPVYLLIRGRSDAARKALPQAEAGLTRVIRELTGGRDAQSIYRVAAGQYLRGLVHQMAGHAQPANQDFAQAALAVARSPVLTASLGGLEPEVLAGFGSLCRVRQAFEVGATFLTQAREAARREGGEKHPTLARIDEEYARLVDDQRRVVEGKTRMMARLEEISKLIKEGEYAEARQKAGFARKDMASAGGDRNMLGWLRFFEFQSLFKDGDYEGAYEALTVKESTPVEIPLQNRGYMASVGVELATRLERPAAEVREWGERCWDARQQGGDPGAAVLCARNAVRMLTLRDEEHEAAPFAERMVKRGTATKDGSLILEGFQTLGDGLLRQGKKKEATELIARLDTTLASLPLSPEERKRRDDLVTAWVAGARPATHEAERKAFLSGK